MEISLRPGHERDFDECWRLYLSAMEQTLREFNIDPVAHAHGFREQWNPEQVRILQADGQDVGWLQLIDRGSELFLAEIFIEPEFQRRGIGTHVLCDLMRHAAARKLPLALSVVKSNRALELYLRLGFRVTHEDDRKFHLRLDPLLDLQP